MKRLALVSAIVVGMTILTVSKQFAIVLVVGVIAGAGLFLYGVASGGGLGNARRFERKPSDINSRMGVCLAAMGIGASAISDERFPFSFRVFYGIAAAIGGIGAIALAAAAASNRP